MPACPPAEPCMWTKLAQRARWRCRPLTSEVAHLALHPLTFSALASAPFNQRALRSRAEHKTNIARTALGTLHPSPRRKARVRRMHRSCRSAPRMHPAEQELTDGGLWWSEMHRGQVVAGAPSPLEVRHQQPATNTCCGKHRSCWSVHGGRMFAASFVPIAAFDREMFKLDRDNVWLACAAISGSITAVFLE